MDRCPECGKPVKRVKTIEGGSVVLDNSRSPSGEGRYSIDYEREAVPVAVEMGKTSPHFGYPLHSNVCVAAGVRR